MKTRLPGVLPRAQPHDQGKSSMATKANETEASAAVRLTFAEDRIVGLEARAARLEAAIAALQQPEGDPSSSPSSAH
jgi:hypothetical protein